MNIIKVRYFLGTTDQLSSREYTYFSADALNIGDIITVPVRDTTCKATVSAVDVPEAEIEAFREKVKVIPTSPITPPSVELMAETPLTPQNVTTAVICIAPEHDTTVISLAEEAKKLRAYAFSRVIAADADLKPATDDLSLIAKLKKALAEKKADYLRPIKAHIDAVNAAFTSIMAPLDEADLVTRNKIKDFRAAIETRRLEAKEINRQKQELAQREAAFNGTGITIDTTPVDVPIPVRRIVTDIGTASTMKVTKWELVDFALVPDQYKMLDSGKITKLVKAGGTIPGIRVYEEETLRVSTR